MIGEFIYLPYVHALLFDVFFFVFFLSSDHKRKKKQKKKKKEWHLCILRQGKDFPFPFPLLSLLPLSSPFPFPFLPPISLNDQQANKSPPFSL